MVSDSFALCAPLFRPPHLPHPASVSEPLGLAIPEVPLTCLRLSSLAVSRDSARQQVQVVTAESPRLTRNPPRDYPFVRAASRTRWVLYDVPEGAVYTGIAKTVLTHDDQVPRNSVAPSNSPMLQVILSSLLSTFQVQHPTQADSALEKQIDRNGLYSSYRPTSLPPTTATRSTAAARASHRPPHWPLVSSTWAVSPSLPNPTRTDLCQERLPSPDPQHSPYDVIHHCR